MDAHSAKEALLKSIETTSRRPSENYVINGKPGNYEVELVLEINSEPFQTYVFERGNKRNLASFRQADDAAMYFFGKLYRFSNFRRAYVAIGGEFSASSNADEYSKAFRAVAAKESIPPAVFSLPGDERKGTALSVGQEAGVWRINGKSDWIGTFDVYADALDFAHWKLTGLIPWKGN